MGRRIMKDSDLLELHAEGCMNIEIAEIMGIDHASVTRRMKRLGIERNTTVHRTAKCYTVYDKKADTYVAEGTVKEISKLMNIKENTVRNYLHRHRHGIGCRYEFDEVKE